MAADGSFTSCSRSRACLTCSVLRAPFADCRSCRSNCSSRSRGKIPARGRLYAHKQGSSHAPGGPSTQAHYTVQNAGQRSRQRSTDLTPTSFALNSRSLMPAFKQRRSLATCQRSLRRHPGGRQTEKCTCPQSITLGTLQTPNRHLAGTLHAPRQSCCTRASGGTSTGVP